MELYIFFVLWRQFVICLIKKFIEHDKLFCLYYCNNLSSLCLIKNTLTNKIGNIICVGVRNNFLFIFVSDIKYTK